MKCHLLLTLQSCMTSRQIPAMKEEKFYSPLEHYLVQVNKECIAMESKDTRIRVNTALSISQEIIKNMKILDPVFEKLFRELTYVGSYFDGLRVKEATEFDMNVVLKLPFKYEALELSRLPSEPGFIQINTRNAQFTDPRYAMYESQIKLVNKWVDAKGFLSHIKVLRWWEGMFSKLDRHGNSTLIVGHEVYKFKCSKSWPAMTVRIWNNSNDFIDVDLALALEFSNTRLPPKPIQVHKREWPWYVVPKFREDNGRLWRVSFPHHEKELIHKKNHLKFVNRFLKRVRDTQNWSPLASYFIKTVFLWEAFTQQDESFYVKNLGYLFVYFLEKLQSYLNANNLPFLWDPNLNLLQKMSPVTIIQTANFIKKCKDRIERSLALNDVNCLNKEMTLLFGVHFITSAANRGVPPLDNDSPEENPDTEKRSWCVIS